jgi:hypothetical protein
VKLPYVHAATIDIPLTVDVSDRVSLFGGVSARINPNIIGYVGAYYQWPSNWKFTGRAGVQSFDGVQLLNRTPIQPFAQPIVRFDLDPMDDNDGVTAQVQWIPKPAYRLTLRTPLYRVRNKAGIRSLGPVLSYRLGREY